MAADLVDLKREPGHIRHGAELYGRPCDAAFWLAERGALGVEEGLFDRVGGEVVSRAGLAGLGAGLAGGGCAEGGADSRGGQAVHEGVPYSGGELCSLRAAEPGRCGESGFGGAIRELVLDDQRLRNDICWSVFDC